MHRFVSVCQTFSKPFQAFHASSWLMLIHHHISFSFLTSWCFLELVPSPRVLLLDWVPFSFARRCVRPVLKSFVLHLHPLLLLLTQLTDINLAFWSKKAQLNVLMTHLWDKMTQLSCISLRLWDKKKKNRFQLTDLNYSCVVRLTTEQYRVAVARKKSQLSDVSIVRNGYNWVILTCSHEIEKKIETDVYELMILWHNYELILFILQFQQITQRHLFCAKTQSQLWNNSV